jgi:hypothetical protein
MRLCRLWLAWWIVLTVTAAFAQSGAAPPQPRPGAEYSGMYNFLREGEFVQVTVEDQGKVNGFISRYGDQESDRGAFLDHFFKQGKLDGNNLTFATETVHGVWFEFKGTIARGEGKKAGDEAFYVIRGTLIEHSTDEQEKASARSREVALKSFPKEMAPEPSKKY